MSPLHFGLFDLTNLPINVATFLKEAKDPVDALNKLPQFLKSLVGTEQHIDGVVEAGAQLHGPVYVGAGSIVHSGVVLEGPVYIGKNVTIRPHANIRHGAYLGDNCVIGHSADVKNTLALHGCKIQDGTFAGDSILGTNARIGSGAIVANRKFNQSNIRVTYADSAIDSQRDFLGAFIGDDARLGANVVTSPGTVIGPHTWVGSGVILQGYVQPDQLITVQQTLNYTPKERITLKAGRAITYDM
jgi:NDP-sugar pyrophosphorylase family protein